MPDFDKLDEVEVNEFEINLITLAGRKKVTVKEGLTVKEFKEQNDLVGCKLIDEDSNILRDSDEIEEGAQIYVSKPKENGRA